MSEDQPSYVDRRQWKYNPMTGEVTPLYTAPPQREYMPDDLIATYEKGFADGKAKREWQGLTDEEIKEILDCGRPNLVNIKKAEQKLKEKNT